MELYVNGEAVDTQLEDEKTVGDVLRSFETYCEDNEAAVVGVTIDDKPIDADGFDAATKQPLEDSTKIGFEVVTKPQITAALKHTAATLKALIPRIEGVSVSLQSGHGKDANEAIVELSDCMGGLSRLAIYITLFPEDYAVLISGERALSSSFKEINPILSDFADALKDGDTVTVGDLAEYEICPRLVTLSQTLEAING